MTHPLAASAIEVQPRRTDGHLPIEDYGVIGDGRTVVLVGIDGSIDWMCMPDIDAPSVFGALLDPAGGGSFSLAPVAPFEARRRYVEHTNLLETTFTTAQGVVRVSEALTIETSQDAPWRELVRSVEGLRGTVRMEWRLRPRFDYGRSSCRPERLDDMFIYRHGALQLGVKAWDAGEPQIQASDISGSFELAAGQRAVLVLLGSDDISLPSPTRQAVERRLAATEKLWRDWVARSSYEGPWKEAVERSLLAIGLLADGRSGAITAAGTTSLPEVVGGKRNYDYRFGWVRDLSFTVDALLRVDMEEPAHAAVRWLLNSAGRTRPRVDPVYALTAEVIRAQRTLPLPGYLGSSPVHVGNQAGSQLQLGGFGDLVETIWCYVTYGHVLAPESSAKIADSLDLLAAIWRREDAGLWELGDYAQYATSKISCWTAFERGLDLAKLGQLPDGHVERWRSERDAIREFIEGQLWSETKGSYVMKAGSEMLDCGVLLAARRGFVDPQGERMNRTIDVLKSELHADGPLFYRYSGMQEQENAFLACSFWMAEALALAGRADEAAEIMDAMIGLASPIGLYAEEMEPGIHAMRGNFPQALSHLSLISAASLYCQATD